ncbi:TMhelix containing protein [Vibrio phage 1.198.B._10N.286.54.F4]|nr:TMhelix containing protein [Vibrio phage 1.198.A._10N.286.54.F4]AUR94830.1 TMhelix containing protein [Vibrio phage 1.198.B._10N.286.54.F4]
MWLIKKIDEDFNEELIQVDCIKSYVQCNLELFKQGWRFYVNDKDVTEDAWALADNRELTMMRPAQTGVELIIGAVVAAVVGAVAVVALTPKPEAPATSNRTQESATNSLGARTNEFNIGGRIDDIWGRVNNHVPRLLQVPHFRFVDNVETENFAVYISQGKVAIDNVRDGQTEFSSLPNGQFNAWWPGGNPNSGASPDFTIGSAINRPLVNVTQSRELQSAELLPPNDLYVGGTPVWRVTSNGSIGTITLSNPDEVETDLTEHFSVGSNAVLFECTVLYSTIATNLYYDDGGTGTPQSFNLFGGVDAIDGTYEITGVTESSVTLDVSGQSWQSYTDKPLLTTFYEFQRQSGFSSSTEDSQINDNNWYADVDLTDPITVTSAETKVPNIGQAFNSAIGPIKIKDFSDTISFNFVADNGFYKYVKNTETEIDAKIEVRILQTDSDGNVTGFETIIDVPFSTNASSKTRQSAKTVDIANPYDYGVIYCRRKTIRDKNDNVQNIDKVFWRDLYFYDDIGTQDYGNVTVAQVVIPSSIAAQGVKERQVNMDVTRYIEPYIGNGSFGPESPVETVAEVVTALSLDPLNGRLTLDEIDADLFLDVQSQLISYYGDADIVKVGYDIDSTKLRFQEIFSLFWDAVRCNAYSQGAVYRVYPNIARTSPSKQFTHRNKIIGTDTKERLYDIEYDGVELTYRSNATGQFETVIKHVDGSQSTNRLKIELSGATQEVQAETRASYELNKIKYQKYNFTFEADGISRLTVPGERVTNVDQTRIVKRENNTNVYNIYDGLVVSIDGLICELSQPVTFEDGETHSIRFTNKKGELLEAIGCTAGSTTYHVVLESTPSESVYTGYKLEKTNFTFAPDKERDGMDVLVLGTKAKQSKGLKTRQLTCINYSDLYYQGDVI